MKENIRLVIWDLDNTLWNGIISEGEVVISPTHKLILNTLVNRGIMNSICSKNDYEAVKSFLENEGIWDLFVFPKISWNSKGPAIQAIVSDCQLRPESVIFIDDNATNLNEAKFYLPTINISTPEIINTLLDNIYFQGKDDSDRTRLKQYKLIELKNLEKAKYLSNDNFLFASNIKVVLHENCVDVIDRIYELIIRTNQLNFTKKDISLDDLYKILIDKSYDCKYVTVTDNYGDYGIVGFLAMHDNNLEHFLFSCRTLGLGVEQWVYSTTGFANIKIVGKPVVELKKDMIPLWINTHANEDKIHSSFSKQDIKMLLIGGCDLEQTSFYINSHTISVESEFNYNYKNYIVHREHSELIRQIIEYTDEEKKRLIDSIPFYDEKLFDSKIFNENYNVIIYSPLIDFSLGIYENIKNNKERIVFGNYQKQLDDISILKDYKYIGPITTTRFADNLQFIRNHINCNTILIVLNGSEQNVLHPEEPNRYLLHMKMNKVLEKFCNENENTYLIEVNKYINSTSDHTDNIRHYSRKIYFEIANEIIILINELFKADLSKKNPKRNESIRVIVKTFLRKLRLLKLGYFVYRKYKKL